VFDITLSFDNGPEPEVTPGVLATLARRDVRASFFVLGRKLLDPASRRCAERAAAEGHWIGNHTFSHSVPLGRQPDEPAVAEAEIGRTQGLIGELGHPARPFRPFGGGGRLDGRLLSQAALQHLRAGRYSLVLWNAIPRDWEDPDGWVERAFAQCAAQPATLLVLHDLPTGAMRHLDRFLASVGDAGGRFRQEFPPACVPLRDGEIVLPLDRYVASSLAAARALRDNLS
jgi:peptidoglycan-N-acetylglucosamine deacetylase